MRDVYCQYFKKDKQNLIAYGYKEKNGITLEVLPVQKMNESEAYEHLLPILSAYLGDMVRFKIRILSCSLSNSLKQEYMIKTVGQDENIVDIFTKTIKAIPDCYSITTSLCEDVFVFVDASYNTKKHIGSIAVVIFYKGSVYWLGEYKKGKSTSNSLETYAIIVGNYVIQKIRERLEDVKIWFYSDCTTAISVCSKLDTVPTYTEGKYNLAHSYANKLLNKGLANMRNDKTNDTFYDYVNWLSNTSWLIPTKQEVKQIEKTYNSVKH